MSAGLTESASLMQGVGQFEAGQTRSKLFNANAQIAVAQGQSEMESGAESAARIMMRGAATTGQQVAAIGANNLQQAGTPAQVVASTAAVNEINALTTSNNAMRRAWGFEVQGASDRLQAGFAKTAGWESGVGSILGGTAKASAEAQQAGGWF